MVKKILSFLNFKFDYVEAIKKLKGSETMTMDVLWVFWDEISSSRRRFRWHSHKSKGRGKPYLVILQQETHVLAIFETFSKIPVKCCWWRWRRQNLLSPEEIRTRVFYKPMNRSYYRGRKIICHDFFNWRYPYGMAIRPQILIHFSLFYSHSNKFDLVSYPDNYWGGDLDGSINAIGFVFFLENAAFTWLSKK